MDSDDENFICTECGVEIPAIGQIKPGHEYIVCSQHTKNTEETIEPDPQRAMMLGLLEKLIESFIEIEATLTQYIERLAKAQLKDKQLKYQHERAVQKIKNEYEKRISQMQAMIVNTMPEAGFIYVLPDNSGIHYKIGQTKNPKSRLRMYQTSYPHPVEYICVIFVADRMEIEHELHKRFADKHVRGEWYALDDKDVAYIKSLAGK